MPSAPKTTPVSPPPPQASTGFPSGSTDSMPSPFPPSGPGADEIVVTRESLPQAVSDKDWKVRKRAYILLSELIVQVGGPNPSGAVDANTVLPGLDDLIASTCLMDKNANSLEAAMEMSTIYADYCRGAAEEERAEHMAVSLIKGNGFSSPKPSSARAAEALTLKIMEVGRSPESLSTVIAVLLDQGFSSRKPKIVQMSCNLVLKAAHSFGAACLPLAAITDSLPKLLSHSNKKIRDVALDIVAELCRAVGSKDPMDEVISKMKKAQEADLDALLEKQPQPTPVQVGLRCKRAPGGGAVTESPEDALAALQASAKEMEAERFAKRPAVDLLADMKETEYASKLKMAKWNEKVAGLNMILEAGGERPYKLVQPSSSVNYVPLMSDMKATLSHTHFAVVGKALEVLSMLAQGVGERLYPNLRPLLPKLFQLSKDKKLTKSTAACLDSFFGNVVSFAHILDSEYAIKEAVDDRKEKNALARTNALDFLSRCITRRESAGPRGHLEPSEAKECAQLATHKLKDPDANVRKAAVNVLNSLLEVEDADVQDSIRDTISDLESSNPRVFKKLTAGSGGGTKPETSEPKQNRVAAPDQQPPVASPARQRVEASNHPASAPKTSKASKSTATATTAAATTTAIPPIAGGSISEDTNLNDAIARCASLGIPLWDAADEDGGIINGLQCRYRSAKIGSSTTCSHSFFQPSASKWQFRQTAIQGIAKFVADREVSSSPSEVQSDSNCLLVLIREHTRGFRETNFNVTKAILEVFLALCDFHVRTKQPFVEWAAADGAGLATEKIADKKLSGLAKAFLTELCVVRQPSSVLAKCYETMDNLRAPAAHEEFSKWFKHFCNDFGASAIGSGIGDSVSFFLKECNSKNVKVKKEALSAMGLLHVHLGPSFQAVASAAAGKDESLRTLLQKAFADHPYDPSAASAEWPKRYIVVSDGGGAGVADTNSGLNLDVPKMDLFSELPDDCIPRMGSKESKTSWKARKGAMEEVESVLQRCSGLLDTSNLKPLIELCRELCERLSDTQSNLKPVAARLLGSVLSSVDASSQAKLGKIVYANLINSAMNENKKMMHDAAMESLRNGTSLHALEGEGVNDQALLPFVAALAAELDETEYKASGISDVLSLTQSFAEFLPDLDHVSSNRGESLGGRFAKGIVDGLTSPKADIRAASESLLQDCISNGVFSIETAKKSAGRLKPAKQRSIGPILAKLSGSSEPIEAEPERNHKVSKVGHRSRASAKSISGRPKSKPRAVSNVEPTKQEEIPATESAHPLVGSANSTGKQKSSSALRLITWPEYPEEPSGSSYFNGLKKAWSPLIPTESTKALFPGGGIKRQDDAMKGCELLKRAIVMETSGEGFAIVEQFGLILKWSLYVLCTKESTVGLQELLSFFSDLFEFLAKQNYELSDAEAAILLPFLWDKASAAKGRFKDTYMELLSQCTSDTLCPPKRLGPHVCVPVIEASSLPVARLLASRKCYECVEKIGLSGIGKKGTLAVAKALSEEKLLENRTAYLDLMELLLSRMNGDMQRFARICGSSLSAKARDLLEERVRSGGARSGSSVSSGTADTSRRPSTIRSSPPRTLAGPSVTKSSPSKAARKAPETLENDFSSSFGDELPALGLRDSPSAIPRGPFSSRLPTSPSKLSQGNRRSNPAIDNDSASNILSSLLDTEEMLEGRSRGSNKSDFEATPLTAEVAPATRLFSSSGSIQSSTSYEQSETGSVTSNDLGAAASLRARLLKIREKNRGGSANETIPSSGIPSPKSSLLQETQNRPAPHEPAMKEKVASGVPHVKERVSEENQAFVQKRDHLDRFLETISSLMAADTPLGEDDADIFATTDVLKTIHAAVSGQAALAVNLTPDEVTVLRHDIEDRANEVVASLTRQVLLSISSSSCHKLECSAGMSVPLLSVNLASLMAIFRSNDLATKVLVDDLTILIKEAGKALLDRRLASSSSTSVDSKLDDATSTQMVRAINKLAVQAATGAKRDVSFQALIALQQQLSMNAHTADESMFNSRLSRVVTKLFSRVIKAEEGETRPFASDHFDTESILCCLEDSLVACRQSEHGNESADGEAASHKLAALLVTAMLRARGELFSLRGELDELGIDSNSSDLGQLVSSCATDLGLCPGSPQASLRDGTSNRDVGALVSAVGSASQGAERERAISALKRYTEMNGNDDLNAHLEQVSGAFRQFILEELSLSKLPSSPTGLASNSMSNRIKSLRSKLNPDQGSVGTTNEHNISTLDHPTDLDAGDSAPTVRAFRARLAAAHEKRTTTSDSDVEERPISDSSGSRAAALRARLQKVKDQSKG
eukprot:scaffold6257_cov144-Cylindrotheca_fusiformis.AAC.1